MTSFATELDALIRKHVGRPRYGDELEPIVTALHVAACRWAGEADRYRWRDESKKDFRERVRGMQDDCWG
jgi:hypothetical protein